MDEVFQLKESVNMMLKSSNNQSSIVGVRNAAFSFGLKRYSNEITPPPSYGQHTREILSQSLSYSDEKIVMLGVKGIIAHNSKTPQFSLEVA